MTLAGALKKKLQDAISKLKFVENGKPMKWVYGAVVFFVVMVLVIWGAVNPKVAANIATMGFDKVTKLITALVGF